MMQNESPPPKGRHIHTKNSNRADEESAGFGPQMKKSATKRNRHTYFGGHVIVVVPRAGLQNRSQSNLAWGVDDAVEAAVVVAEVAVGVDGVSRSNVSQFVVATTDCFCGSSC